MFTFINLTCLSITRFIDYSDKVNNEYEWIMNNECVSVHKISILLYIAYSGPWLQEMLCRGVEHPRPSPGHIFVIKFYVSLSCCQLILINLSAKLSKLSIQAFHKRFYLTWKCQNTYFIFIGWGCPSTNKMSLPWI